MKNTNKLLVVLLAVAMLVSSIAVTTLTTSAVEGTEGLNTQAWHFPADQYGALMGNGIHSTNGDTVKASVAAGTGFTAMNFDAVSGVNSVGNADWYVIKYTGVIVAEETGWYQLSSRKVDNGYIAYVAGEKVFDMAKHASWLDNGRVMYCGEKMYLEAGVAYSYEAYFIEQDGGDALEMKVRLADGSEKSFADAGIKFYADVAADANATVEIDDSIPTLAASPDKELYYNNFEGTPLFMDGDDSVEIGTEILDGRTDVAIEFVVKTVDANRGGLTNHAGFAGIGTNAETNWVVMGYRDHGAIKFGMRTVDAEIGKDDSGKTDDNLFHCGVWYTIKYTFSETTVKAYIDGVELKSWDITGQKTIGEIEGNFVFGKELKWNDPGFKGYVSEIRVTTSEEPAENNPGEDNPGEDLPTINPYETVKAGVGATEISVGTTYDGSEFGIEQNGGDNDGGVGTTYDGAWMKYANVAFGANGAKSITINYISKATRMMEDAAAEIWIDGMEGTGTKVATVALPVPEDRNADYTKLVATADLDSVVTGTHDLYIVLTGTCDNTQDNEYVANVTNFVFAEVEDTGSGEEGGEGNEGGEGSEEEEVVSNTKLSATDKEVLFYTDFSNVSDLVVRQTTVNNWPNHEADDIVDPVFDTDGNLLMRPEQYISFGADMLKGQDELIIEFVVKPDAIVNHAAFAGIGANLPNINEADWIVFGMRDDGAVKFGSKSNDIEVGAGDSGKSDGGMLTVGEWVNVKYEITATTVKVYVNGDEVKSWDVTGQKTLSELAEIENAEFIFGKEMRFGDAGFSGAVSEIRVTTTTADDSSSKPGQTGDVASVAALLLAGAAALGGLTLRKRSK